MQLHYVSRWTVYIYILQNDTRTFQCQVHKTTSISADNDASDFLKSDLSNTIFCSWYRMFIVRKMKIILMTPMEGDFFICGGCDNRVKFWSVLGKRVLKRGLVFIETFIVFHARWHTWYKVPHNSFADVLLFLLVQLFNTTITTTTTTTIITTTSNNNNNRRIIRDKM